MDMNLSFELQPPLELQLFITKPEKFELNENELSRGDFVIEFRVRSKSLWKIRTLTGGTSVVKRESGPSITHRHGFDPSFFKFPQDSSSYQCISEVVLSILGIKLKQRMLKSIVSNACDIVNRDNSGKKTLFMCVELIKQSVYLHHEAEVIRPSWCVLEKEQYNQMMREAWKEAIDSLEIVEFNDGNHEFITTCMVCLDEFFETTGSSEEATLSLLRLPCSHVFHGNCVKQWLESSHICPICRVEVLINYARSKSL